MKYEISQDFMPSFLSFIFLSLTYHQLIFKAQDFRIDTLLSFFPPHVINIYLLLLVLSIYHFFRALEM